MKHGMTRSIAMMAACFSGLALTGCAHLVILHDPLTAAEHGDLGVAYETTGKLDLAAKEYRRSLKLDPQQSRTRVNLGNVQAATGSWRKAERSYRRALSDSSTNTDAMNNLAVALVRQGRNWDEARTLALGAIAMAGHPDSNYTATLAEIEASAHMRPVEAPQR